MPHFESKFQAPLLKFDDSQDWASHIRTKTCSDARPAIIVHGLGSGNSCIADQAYRASIKRGGPRQCGTIGQWGMERTSSCCFRGWNASRDTALTVVAVWRTSTGIFAEQFWAELAETNRNNLNEVAQMHYKATTVLFFHRAVESGESLVSLYIMDLDCLCLLLWTSHLPVFAWITSCQNDLNLRLCSSGWSLFPVAVTTSFISF